MCFHCMDSDHKIRARIRFVDAFPVESPVSWEELQSLSLRHKKLLVLGVFGWSNYSHEAMWFLVRHWAWFEANGVGLAAFCLGDESVIESICPNFVPIHRTMTTEPAMLVVERGSLKQIRIGRVQPEFIMPWVLWDGRGSPPSSKIFPPSNNPLWDREIDGTRSQGNGDPKIIIGADSQSRDSNGKWKG